MKQINLEKHIQYLRGFSILLVFLYHLKLPYFDKGYLGVDIFLVISGYVITNSYLKNQNNIYLFYKKRFFRIFPPLIIFSIFVFIACLLLATPNISFKKSFLGSLFGITNIMSLKSYTISEANYFVSIFEDPFHHTWSLGLEIQFYILFPLLFIFLKNLNLQNILIILIIFFTLFLSIYFAKINPNWTFYFTGLRLWEFLFGCLCVFYNKTILKFLNYPKLIFIIFIIILQLDNLNPIIYNLTAVIFASIFIVILNKKKLFFEKPFISFGNISYSFYLYHLPVIYFCNFYLDGLIKWVLIIILSFSLSYLSFLIIEQKKIYEKIIPFKKQLYLLTTSIILLIVYVEMFNQNFKNNIRNLIYSFNYLEKHYNWTDRIKWDVKINNYDVFTECASDFEANRLNNNCLINNNKDTVLFINGDSHTAHYIYFLKELDDVDIYIDIWPAYSTKINYKNIKNAEKKYKNLMFLTNVQNSIELNRIKQFVNKTKNSFPIILFNSTPTTNRNKPYRCLVRRMNCGEDKKIIFDKTMNNDLLILSKNNNNVYLFDSFNILCPKNECSIYDKNKDLILLRDQSHLTKEASLLLKDEFESFIQINSLIDY